MDQKPLPLPYHAKLDGCCPLASSVRQRNNASEQKRVIFCSRYFIPGPPTCHTDQEGCPPVLTDTVQLQRVQKMICFVASCALRRDVRAKFVVCRQSRGSIARLELEIIWKTGEGKSWSTRNGTEPNLGICRIFSQTRGPSGLPSPGRPSAQIGSSAVVRRDLERWLRRGLYKKRFSKRGRAEE